MEFSTIRSTAAGIVAVAGVFASFPAKCSVEISSKPTLNMSCSSGLCTPTAKKAVLNVNDLMTMLGSGDISVKSDAKSKDLYIDAALSWAGAQRLTLDSYHSIVFNKSIVVSGTGGLTITTNDGSSGGDFNFAKKANVEFWGTASSLIINAKSFVLVNDIATLANDIANDQTGNYALAKSYNAKPDGKYKQSPITWGLEGTFEGLGNHIDNLTVNAKPYAETGLFADIDHGVVHNFGLINATVTSANQTVGTLAETSTGLIQNCTATGNVSSANSSIGGLVGVQNAAEIINSSADVTVTGSGDGNVGGLVGSLNGEILDSHASGAVTGGDKSYAGGLVGFYNGQIARSYATGAVVGGEQSFAGGLVGNHSGTDLSQSYATGSVSGSTGSSVGGLVGAGINITQSYSTGEVTGGTAGGLIGLYEQPGTVSDNYWDLDTSGISDPSRGAGNVANAPGIAGLTDLQLKSALPAGFDPKVWGQKASVNNGYPYLLDIPPIK